MEKNEICLRNGCTSFLEEHETEESCTCHLGHPPCSYCVTDRTYCPECGWEGNEDQIDENYENPYAIGKFNYDDLLTDNNRLKYYDWPKMFSPYSN